ncbi:unnamed protein product [Sordaria macrospora k-hell]|uniref:WGS project CABT00000000 data, contig 2.1 n=1 Tax=Sordaria macrospora (strain ATCC MYA-333 / DSM 997 / K(L3346) / K-hell) TaxID=771870 RepID=F7VLM8_SORMK|nr:uncharacterized protein SMAC_00621 [Sordaria macrospora k-hell]CCC06406.1 unnamed protein product [Sordaria macrospora k-hell]
MDSVPAQTHQGFKEAGAASASHLTSTTSLPTKVESRTAVMEALEDIVYGSAAGIVGKYIEYPFDTVKVRLQSQPDHLPLRYTGPLDCFRQSIRADGFLGLYRGITAPLVGAALENSSLFFFERIGRGLIYSSGLRAARLRAFLVRPLLVKCKIQVPDEPGGTGRRAPLKPIPVIKEIFRHEGLRGFWHGQLGTLIREAGGCAAWFGSKETTSKWFRERNERTLLKRGGTQDEVLESRERALPLWQQAVAGASAGMSYNFLFFPADTVKSRMQTSPIGNDNAGKGEGQGGVAGPTKKNTFGQEARALWKQAGIKGFYRGCGITVLRSAPSSAFIFMVYDGLKKYFPMA